MSAIVLSNVSFSYSDALPLIVDLDLQIPAGWTGVVGANGAGKTTLLELLAGRRVPDSGSVRTLPEEAMRHLCPQTVDRLTPEVERFANARGRVAQRIRGQLALEAAELEHWDGLSPGQRKRWQVGAALANQPDVLLLDEPTNHLDDDARTRLIAALRSFRGIGVVVSHDRTLLEALTMQTIRVRPGEMRCWSGAYASARAAWEQEERQEVDAYQRLQSEKRRLRRRLADARRKRAVAESRARTSKRMKGIKDSDTRGRFKAKRRRSAEVSLGRETHKLRAGLERLAERSRGFELHKSLGRAVAVDWVASPVSRLTGLDLAELRAGSELLLQDVRIEVTRDSRVHLTGPNGAGKTSLLRRLIEALRVPPTRVLYLPQEFTAPQERALLEELRSVPASEQGRVLSIVAALGVDPEALLASLQPSPGEARKLALAFGLARQVWALLLDEPTNHLDLPSIERLEVALSEYPGALLVVTHDEAFARRCTDTVWKIHGRRLVVSGRGPDASGIGA